MNVELLQRIREQILAEPTRFDMRIKDLIDELAARRVLPKSTADGLANCGGFAMGDFQAVSEEAIRIHVELMRSLQDEGLEETRGDGLPVCRFFHWKEDEPIGGIARESLEASRNQQKTQTKKG